MMKTNDICVYMFIFTNIETIGIAHKYEWG